MLGLSWTLSCAEEVDLRWVGGGGGTWVSALELEQQPLAGCYSLDSIFYSGRVEIDH